MNTQYDQFVKQQTYGIYFSIYQRLAMGWLDLFNSVALLDQKPSSDLW